MGTDPEPNQSSQLSHGVFATTHWSVVLAAKNGDTAAARAMEFLCRAYWRPVYAYIRRDGRGSADAQDLTQEFFSRFIEKDWLGHLQDQRGKFRSFLLTFLKHFLSDERDRANAQKRGGGHTFISLDELEEEEHHALEPVDALTPDQVFERRWAQTLMARAVERLRQEYVDDGKAELFDQLKDLHPGERAERNYADIGAQLGLSEGAVKSAVHRLRLRHRELLRKEIASTIRDPRDVDEEIQQLIHILGA